MIKDHEPNADMIDQQIPIYHSYNRQIGYQNLIIVSSFVGKLKKVWLKCPVRNRCGLLERA